MARRRFPVGHLVAHVHRHIPQALDETRQVIGAGTAPALFETAFEHEHVLVRADILERLPAGGCSAAIPVRVRPSACAAVRTATMCRA